MERPGGVVTIIGGPVIGKTCLAASWMNSALLSNRSTRLFWYRIDDADHDIATFFQLFGEAAVEWAAPHPKLPAYSAEADLGGFTAAWVKALFRVTPRTAIAFIFDDVHRLAPDAPLLLVLGKLARALGDADRLILISRQEIPAQITDAARRQQRLIRITDLEIDESEFADFQRGGASGDPLTREVFLAALRQSGKWMEGLPLLQLMGSSPNAVHERLADVLAGFDDAERAALVATAYLQVGFERDWGLLGGPVAVAALSKIKIATGLVGRLQNHALRKHDVVFDEVKDWAEANAPPQDLVRAQTETGRFLISRGAVLSGVRLLVAAKAVEETRAVVLDQASHLIDQAKNQELLAIIAALPPKEQSRPAIRLWAAYARLPFSPDEAAAALAAIRTGFARELSVSERVLAINGEIYGALSTMRVDEHVPELIKAATALTVQLTAVQEPMRSRLFIGRLVAILLGAPGYRGHAAIRKEAKDLLPDLTPESQLILGAALVTHLLWSEGDVEAARTLHHQIAEQALHPDAAHLPVMNWHIGAISLAFRDGDEQALQTALKALEDFAKRRGLDRRLAPAYWVATQAFVALGNHDAATRTLEKHLVLTHAMGTRHQYEQHFLRSAVALGRGDFAIAAQEATAGWSIADRYGAIQGRRQNAVVLAMSLAFAGNASASAAIDEVAQAGRDTKNRIFLLHAALAGAALAHARRRWKAFESAWNEVTRLSLSTGIRALTGVNADALGSLARDALLPRVDPETTRLFIQSWQLLPPAGEPANPAWPYRLEVNCLGRDEIELVTYDERGQRASIQARSKTKNLLALLVAAEARTLPQEALIEALWPEAEAEDASDRLRQQIRDLRKLTTYEGVVFGDGRYRLNDRLVMTDVQRLEESIHAFSDRRNVLPQRIAAFDSALRLYRGPILPDSESRLVAESRERLAAHLKAMGTGFLRALARQDATKAALRRRRLAKLV